MAIKTYPVLERLLHDGVLLDPAVKPGVTVDLEEDDAADLPEGVLGEPSKKAKEPPAK